MCDFSSGFILCKCKDTEVDMRKKKSKRKTKNKHQNIEYIWILNKFIGTPEEKELGRYLAPGNDAGHGLTSDYVLNELNSRNCFDFEYTPNEGDNLVIKKADAYTRIEFIFRSGQWVAEHYDPFDHECEKIDAGKLKKA